MHNVLNEDNLNQYPLTDPNVKVFIKRNVLG